jgi:hypothetical protein
MSGLLTGRAGGADLGHMSSIGATFTGLGGPSPALPVRTFVRLRRIARLCRSALAPAARPARVAALLVAVIAMSLADLYMTLAHLLHFGMIEANPLARRIMETGTPAEIIIWKLTTVLVAVGILFAFRRRRAAEIGALVCFIALGWLTAHWLTYNESISALTAELHALAAVNDTGFVTMAPTRPGE